VSHVLFPDWTAARNSIDHALAPQPVAPLIADTILDWSERDTAECAAEPIRFRNPRAHVLAAGRDPMDTDLLLAAKAQRLCADLCEAVQNNLSNLLGWM